MRRITESLERLRDDASIATGERMWQATERIDGQFGRGFAREHPFLVGAFIQAAATDFAASVQAQQVTDALDNIARKLPC